MRLLRSPVRSLIAITALATATVAGCGGDDAGTAPDLPPDAQEGRAIMASNGCASCHGSNGEGGAGPSWVGLAGSEVELEDGRTVVADRDYLRRSITDPQAEVVDGFSVRMPENGLDDEVDLVVDYIEALG